MKVTIDTKEDSHEDIRRVLGILSHMLENKEESSISTYERKKSHEEVKDTSNMMSMFANNYQKAERKEIPDTPPDFSSFMSLTEKKENNEDDDAKIEFF